jgi:hypothetical protein
MVRCPFKAWIIAMPYKDSTQSRPETISRRRAVSPGASGDGVGGLAAVAAGSGLNEQVLSEALKPFFVVSTLRKTK